MFPQPQPKTLNRATVLMLCLTSVVMLLTTFNRLGDGPHSNVLFALAFVAVGCTALLLALIATLSGVTLPDRVDLTFLYTDYQMCKMRRVKYLCMSTILLVQCSLLAVLLYLPSMIPVMAICLSLMLYLSYWLALYDMRIVATVENYCDW